MRDIIRINHKNLNSKITGGTDADIIRINHKNLNSKITGGTDADDELSCWEGPYFPRSSDEDMETTECSGLCSFGNVVFVKNIPICLSVCPCSTILSYM